MYIDNMGMPSDNTVGAWTLLLRAHHTAFSNVEAALKQAGLPPLTWYDVLLELDRAGREGLRPIELEHELLLPQYGISRLVHRIERAGYLIRKPTENDRRGLRLVISDAGIRARQKMWEVYGPAIENAIGEKITSPQADNLSDLLVQLID